MKAQFFAASALVLTLSAANAQPLASARPGSVPAGLIPGRQTGDSREWLKVESVDDAFQGTILKTNRAFVELATGMSYWDGQQWLPSDPTFDTTTNGFIASRMQHKVHLAENINDLGTVTLVTPDGKCSVRRRLGLGFTTRQAVVR